MRQAAGPAGYQRVRRTADGRNNAMRQARPPSVSGGLSSSAGGVSGWRTLGLRQAVRTVATLRALEADGPGTTRRRDQRCAPSSTAVGCGTRKVAGPAGYQRVCRTADGGDKANEPCGMQRGQGTPRINHQGLPPGPTIRVAPARHAASAKAGTRRQETARSRERPGAPEADWPGRLAGRPGRQAGGPG